MLSAKLVVPPEPAVTLQEAKWHLRVDHDDDDIYIEDILIPAATAHFDGPEGRLRRAIMPQTWEMAIDAFPSNEILLPVGPTMSVTSILYDDADGAEQTVASTDYAADAYSETGWVVLVAGVSWPATLSAINSVRVRWVAGMGAECPADIKAAILLMLGNLYKNREAAGAAQAAVPMGVDALIWIKKRIVLA